MKITLSALLVIAAICILTPTTDAFRYIGNRYRYPARYGFGNGFRVGYRGYYGYQPYYNSYYPYSQYYYRSALNTNSLIQCSYFHDKTLLNCTLPAGSYVSCPAFGVFADYKSESFNFLAISSTPVTSLDSNLLGYSLYPELLETKGWLNTSFTDEDVQYKYSIYYGENVTDNGVRINDLECYNRLLSLFSDFTRRESIIVDEQNIDIIGGLFLY